MLIKKQLAAHEDFVCGLICSVMECVVVVLGLSDLAGMITCRYDHLQV